MANAPSVLAAIRVDEHVRLAIVVEIRGPNFRRAKTSNLSHPQVPRFAVSVFSVKAQHIFGFKNDMRHAKIERFARVEFRTEVSNIIYMPHWEAGLGFHECRGEDKKPC